MTTTTIRRNVFIFEMRSRSSSDKVDSTDSFDTDLKEEKIDLGPCHSRNHQGGRSNQKIGLQLGLSTPSQGDPDREQTFRGYRVQKIYKCITNNFALNENPLHICAFFLLV